MFRMYSYDVRGTRHKINSRLRFATIEVHGVLHGGEDYVEMCCTQVAEIIVVSTPLGFEMTFKYCFVPV